MRTIFRTALIFAATLSAAACDTYTQTPMPDYTIHVVQTSNGLAALPPACPDMTTALASPFDNQPMPQFGCANARNLAMMVEQPNDLVRGRNFGDGSGVMATGAMRRYYNNQTRGLLDLSSSPDLSLAVTSAPTASSSMSGDAASSGSSSGGAAAAAAPAAP